MPPALAAELFDLLARRRVEAMRRGWGLVPELVFPCETGGPIHHANLERSWIRLRRKAQARAVRPLKLHSTRHTYASLALASGKSVKMGGRPTRALHTDADPPNLRSCDA